MTNNYHFSCCRTQQDEGETIAPESDSNGLKAAIKYLEDNFYVGNLQWAHLGFVNPPIDKNELVLAKDSLPVFLEKLPHSKGNKLATKSAEEQAAHVDFSSHKCCITVTDSGQCIGLQCTKIGFRHLVEAMKKLANTPAADCSCVVEHDLLGSGSFALEIRKRQHNCNI